MTLPIILFVLLIIGVAVIGSLPRRMAPKKGGCGRCPRYPSRCGECANFNKGD